MLNLLLQTLWIFLPAGIANMAPVLFRWVPFLGIPVDFGLKYRNKPFFGKNKTYRGFLFAVLVAIFIVYLQKVFYTQTNSIAIINYTQINVFLLGFLLGFGALFGDLIKSFFKRQVGIKAGKSWLPFDQIDWIIGSSLLLLLYIKINWLYYVIAFIVLGVLHPVVNVIGYLLKIKKNIL